MTKSRIEMIDEHMEKFRCAHQETDLRKQIVKNGAVQYVRQCARCGVRTSQAIARYKAVSEYGSEPPVFDESMRVRWKEQERNEFAAIDEYFSAKEKSWWEWYAQYLESPEWKTKRAKVIARSKGICEGCLEAPATQVHHLSYKHAGDELLFELVAICNSCHDKAHHDEYESDGATDDSGAADEEMPLPPALGELPF